MDGSFVFVFARTDGRCDANRSFPAGCRIRVHGKKQQPKRLHISNIPFRFRDPGFTANVWGEFENVLHYNTFLSAFSQQPLSWFHRLEIHVFLSNSSQKKMLKMYSLSGHLRCVCVFFLADLEKCSITSLAHQWMLCSEWVPSE